MSGVIEVDVLGIGLVGPGLASWDEALPVLRGDAPYLPAPTAVPLPLRLPAAERRRAGASVKVALCVADAACIAAGRDPAELATVVTSSGGDGANCHALCETLGRPPGPDRMVSPTRFTNSVHNAAAGYWHIAVGSRHASTSVCAHDYSFGAGLVAAIGQLPGLGSPVLLVSSETPYPEPLHAARPLPDVMGIGLVLGAAGGPGVRIRLKVRLLPSAQAGAATHCHDAALEALRASLPTARALPLLEAIARRRSARVVLPGSPQLALEMELEFAS